MANKPGVKIFAVDANNKELRYEVATQWVNDFGGLNFRPVFESDTDAKFPKMSLLSVLKANEEQYAKDKKCRYFLNCYVQTDLKAAKPKGQASDTDSDSPF